MLSRFTSTENSNLRSCARALSIAWTKKLLRLKTVEKGYVAMVEGTVKDDLGTIDEPIGRFEERKSWNVKPDGKPAQTRFRVLERRRDSTRLELEPITGRTNQLRIHCAAIGHPIVGDLKRGGREFPRLCLHASRLCFHHPTSGNRMEFKSEIPPDFAS
jgi:23S rRNA-/tRNA-specific pseudouridylate synthase